jgi:hypothetical protein
VANCQGEFTLNDLKRMELVVLDKLKWRLPSSSTVSMLQNMTVFAATELGLTESDVDEVLDIATGKYVSCMLSYELLRFQPSTVAACVLVEELSAVTHLAEGWIFVAILWMDNELIVFMFQRPLWRCLRMVLGWMTRTCCTVARWCSCCQLAVLSATSIDEAAFMIMSSCSLMTCFCYVGMICLCCYLCILCFDDVSACKLILVKIQLKRHQRTLLL